MFKLFLIVIVIYYDYNDIMVIYLFARRYVNIPLGGSNVVVDVFGVVVVVGSDVSKLQAS